VSFKRGSTVLSGDTVRKGKGVWVEGQGEPFLWAILEVRHFKSCTKHLTTGQKKQKKQVKLLATPLS
jgi:hypothetical protein